MIVRRENRITLHVRVEETRTRSEVDISLNDCAVAHESSILILHMPGNERDIFHTTPASSEQNESVSDLTSLLREAI